MTAPEKTATGPGEVIDAVAAVCASASLPALVIRLGEAAGSASAQATHASTCHPLPVLEVGEDFTGNGRRSACGAAAHEAAHIALGHVAVKRRLRNYGILAFLASSAITIGFPGDAPSWLPYLTIAVFYLVRCQICIRMEYQADAHGIEILGRSGLPGREYMTEALEGLLPDQAWHRYGWMLTSHPTTMRRLAVIRKGAIR